jgi:hypothetical protein
MLSIVVISHSRLHPACVATRLASAISAVPTPRPRTSACKREHLAARSVYDIAQDTDKPPVLLGEQRTVFERLLNRAEARHPQRIPACEEALDRRPIHRLELSNTHTTTQSRNGPTPSSSPPAPAGSRPRRTPTSKSALTRASLMMRAFRRSTRTRALRTTSRSATRLARLDALRRHELGKTGDRDGPEIETVACAIA